jgi:hypothetical protein
MLELPNPTLSLPFNLIYLLALLSSLNFFFFFEPFSSLN